MNSHLFARRKAIAMAVAAALSVFTALIVFLPGTGHPAERASTGAPSAETVVHFMRARFGIADNTQIQMGEWHDSASPEFSETTLTLDDGKPQNHKVVNVYATKDGRYIGFGNLHTLKGDMNAEIIRSVRQQYKVPENVALAAGPPEPSKFASFYTVRISTNTGKGQDFFLTRDRQTLVLGSLLPFSEHPEEDVERIIAMGNQPSVGPAHAPVTVVEYADLECPTCARMHQFLESDLLPKYKDKVRIVFKEFPLVAIHEWALAGALANECAYEIDPKTYLPYRTLIFQQQKEFDPIQNNASQVRDLLLKYGQQVGLDSAKLAPCLDSRRSLSRVEEGLKEGKELNLEYTPTFYINGRAKVGLVSPEDFYRAVDDALRDSGKEKLHAESRRR